MSDLHSSKLQEDQHIFTFLCSLFFGGIFFHVNTSQNCQNMLFDFFLRLSHFYFYFLSDKHSSEFKKNERTSQIVFFFFNFPRFLLISFACENLSEYQHTREILFLFFVFENIQGEYPSESDGVCTHQHTLCLTKCVLRFTKCVHKDSWD